MKVSGNGQGKVLTAKELERLFSDGFASERDRPSGRYAERNRTLMVVLIRLAARHWRLKLPISEFKKLQGNYTLVAQTFSLDFLDFIQIKLTKNTAGLNKNKLLLP